ncbi:MAG: hypothetical protein ABI650_11850 [Dokdonella sp.]
MNGWLFVLLVVALAGLGLWSIAPEKRLEEVAVYGRKIDVEGTTIERRELEPPRRVGSPEADQRVQSSPSVLDAESSWQAAQRINRCMPYAPYNGVGWIREESAAAKPAECDDIEPTLKDAHRLLKQAAALGSHEAQVVYAGHPGLSPQFANVDLEAWIDWRGDAPRYLEDAVGRGDALAAMMKGLASLDSCTIDDKGDAADPCMRSQMLREILPRDDVVAYAHLRFAQQLDPSSLTPSTLLRMEQLGGLLTTAQIAQAEVMVQQMLSRVRP